MKPYFPKVLLVLPLAALLGGCVAVPYDPYYSAPAVYPGYSVYPAQPVYVAPYSSSFYFGYGGGWGGHRRWHR